MRFGDKHLYRRIRTMRASALLLFAAGVVAAELNPSQVFGELVAKLSESNVVSVQTHDGYQWITIQAQLGRVAHPAGMTRDSGIRYDTELVPGDAGLVVHFYGARVAGDEQKQWQNAHDAERRSGERVLPLSEGNILPLKFSYGPRCDPALIAWLMTYRATTAAAPSSP
jgi:hypothetical protein